MAYKNNKKTEEKKQELPSFLFQSPKVPENISFGEKTVKNGSQLGPIFFGCYEYQPMLHNLNLGLSFDVHKTASSTENLLRHAFLSNVPSEIWFEKRQVVTSYPRKPQVLFSDPFLHRCPGQRRAFVPEPAPEINLGETVSTIEGEALQEIPLYCVRESFDGGLERDYKVLFLSDIWEKRRIYMSSKERMAHTHFPKQFVTLQVIGPTIPSSITIKKLPSKRKTESQLDLELKLKTKAKKEVKKEDVKTKKAFESASEEKEEMTAPFTEKLGLELTGKSEDEAREGSVHEELHDESVVIEEEENAKDEEEIKDGEDEVNEATDEVPDE